MTKNSLVWLMKFADDFAEQAQHDGRWYQATGEENWSKATFDKRAALESALRSALEDEAVLIVAHPEIMDSLEMILNITQEEDFCRPADSKLYEVGTIARCAIAKAPTADQFPFEKMLSELVDKIAPGLDSGDLLADAREASKRLDSRGVEPWCTPMPRDEFLRAALSEIADSKSLTATPTQFYQHLQRIASRALTTDAMAERWEVDMPPCNAREEASRRLDAQNAQRMSAICAAASSKDFAFDAVCKSVDEAMRAAQPTTMTWRVEAARWLRRKAEHSMPEAGKTGWANPDYWRPQMLVRAAEELEAEQEAAPYGEEPSDGLR